MVYDMAVWALSDLQDDWGTFNQPHAEAASLSAVILRHMAEGTSAQRKLTAHLICPVSPAYAQRIANQLVEHANQRLEVGHITATTDLDIEPADLDLTISTVPTKSASHTLVISPFPTEHDFQAVTTTCADIQHQRGLRMLSLYFRYYLREATFIRARGQRTRSEVLDEVCKVLAREELVTERFREQLERRERIDSTSFAHVVALPHTCTSSVRHNAISVYLSDTPVPWGADAVNLVVVIAIERELLRDFYAIYEMCIETLSKPANTVTMLGATGTQDFIERLEKLA